MSEAIGLLEFLGMLIVLAIGYHIVALGLLLLIGAMPKPDNGSARALVILAIILVCLPALDTCIDVYDSFSPETKARLDRYANKLGVVD